MECYFRRLSVRVDPSEPGFEEARWITSEDVNVEHLLNAFTSIDANSDNVWEVCVNFTEHIRWHKRRLVVLGPMIEGLPDDHPSKPQCLFELSQLFDSVGNPVECKRLLIYASKLWRERGMYAEVAEALMFLSSANMSLGLHEEGISQTKEALEIYEQLDDVWGQAHCLQQLARWLHGENQLAAAEEAASRAIHLSLDEDELLVCRCHFVLGNICRSKGEIEMAINRFERALGIASSFDWHEEQFGNHYALADLFSKEGRFDEAHAHIERAKSHTVNDTYNLGRTMGLHAQVWYAQHRLEEATAEALCAADVFERLGATTDVEGCKKFLQRIEAKRTRSPLSVDESDFDAEFLGAVLLLHLLTPSPAQGTGQWY
jgi:tetratricopeptide (TPR) repeat protein